jgi:parvulin-like peptidyl-prolyl isomerase
MLQLPRTRPSSLALALALAFTVGACADLTAPGNGAPPQEPDAPTPAAEAAAPAPAPTPAPAPAAPPQEQEQVGASHVLIMYKGSMRAPAEVTRTKEEAKRLATEVMGKAKKGADFDGLAKQYSDEPGSKTRMGKLGKFAKGAMVKPFADAAFALKVGEISNVVETDFGFHVIKRTE